MSPRSGKHRRGRPMPRAPLRGPRPRTAARHRLRRAPPAGQRCRPSRSSGWRRSRAPLPSLSVSPVSTVTASDGMPSVSATICARTVRIPCPIEVAPVLTTTCGPPDTSTLADSDGPIPVFSTYAPTPIPTRSPAARRLTTRSRSASGDHTVVRLRVVPALEQDLILDGLQRARVGQLLGPQEVLPAQLDRVPCRA